MTTCRKLQLTFVVISAIAAAQELSWPELVTRPEFWPTHTTVKEAIKLQGRNSVVAGQQLVVVSVRGNDVVEVETPDGRSTLSLKADKTDVLSAARDGWRRLTPDQRALTYTALLQRRDLWPYRVKLLQPVRLNTNEVRAGESVVLKGIEGGNLLVAFVSARALFVVAPRDTDLLESARKLVQDRKALPGRITEDLNGKLIDPLTGAQAPLEVNGEPRYYAFYRGAAWCGPCRQFSPTLVKFYKEMKPRHPFFEIIYISGDKSAAEMRGYAKEAGFSWRTVVTSRQPELQLVNPLFTEFIPQLVVTDRQGTVLIDSAKTGPAAALEQLDALLKKS